MVAKEAKKLDSLARCAATGPSRPALAGPEGVVSYGELDETVRRGAGALREAGLKPGGRVAIWGGNDPQTVAALWSVWRAEGVAAPLNTRLGPPQLRRQLEELDPSLLLVGEGAPDLTMPSLPMGDLAGGLPAPPEEEGEQEVRCILHTSGSTGGSRAVVLTRENLESSAEASAALLGNGPSDRWLAVLPLYHVGGLSILWRSAREGGAVVLEPRFDASRVAGLLTQGEASLASVVPTMLHRLLETHGGPFPEVRAVLVGGGPAPPGLLERALDAGLPVLPTYGMTETASQVVTMPPGETGVRPGSSGRPLPGVELRILGEDDLPVPAGLVGTIEVRGPMVSPGYLGEPPRPRGSWFRSNDLGYLDGDGYLTVTGRVDDVVITGGE
ncbi:MAG: AMP-binding protein, partial [Actinomycetota bacterium]|nr:AMP-binding protein [Actinomycetota bacterium]